MISNDNKNQGPIIVHATSLTLYTPAGWRGVLITGPSGIGKSDLAIRCLNAGFNLVSDDYSELWRDQSGLFARAPKTIKNKIEVRGIGILTHPSRAFSRIHALIHCQSEPTERMPEREATRLLGLAIPSLRLRPLEASTVAKLTAFLTVR